jgi:hypothetical protein
VTDDPDATREFTLAETLAYNPRQCPVCGQRTMSYRFTSTRSLGAAAGAEEMYRRTRGACSNRQCALRGGPEGTVPS